MARKSAFDAAMDRYRKQMAKAAKPSRSAPKAKKVSGPSVYEPHHPSRKKF
jgi:hypothetical protein